MGSTLKSKITLASFKRLTLVILLLIVVPFALATFSSAQEEETFDEDLLEELDLSEEELEELYKELEDVLEEEEEDIFDDEEEFFEDEGEAFPMDPDMAEEYGIEAPKKKKKKKQQKFVKIDIPMVYVKGGCFMMGDNFDNGYYDEKPVHRACVDDYYISTTEVTQELWIKVMGFNPSISQGKSVDGGEDEDTSKKPVEYVSWNDVNDFLNILNQKTGQYYRLPTEAEWEYAARGGARLEEWPGTNDELVIEEFAWYSENAEYTTHDVAVKRPNAIGVYDMSGNVWEWVYDHYDMNYYEEAPTDNPEGPESGVWRGLRGGSFSEDIEKLRTSTRYGNVPTRRSANVGIRIVQ